NFNQQKQWITGMVAQCTTLARQAQMVADAHKKVRSTGELGWNRAPVASDGEHPTTYEDAQCDAMYKRYSEYYKPYMYMVMDWYKKLQKNSETALATYIAGAGIPLPPLNPTSPYPAHVIKDPDDIPDTPDVPDVPDVPNDGGFRSTPMLPTMPAGGMGGTPPATPDAAALMKDAMKKSGTAKGAGGMKPASLGGGGGMGGMPKMPLQPSTGDGAKAMPAAAA